MKEGLNIPDMMIEIALTKLFKSPKKWAFLKRLDVIFFDEVGQLSKEHLAMIDVIMRRVKGSDKPFGGCLFMGTGDHRQLTPISGGPMWLSSMLITSFDVMYLKHLVRSANDKRLQYVLDKTRKVRTEKDEIDGIINRLRNGI